MPETNTITVTNEMHACYKFLRSFISVAYPLTLLLQVLVLDHFNFKNLPWITVTPQVKGNSLSVAYYLFNLQSFLVTCPIVLRVYPRYFGCLPGKKKTPSQQSPGT